MSGVEAGASRPSTVDYGLAGRVAVVTGAATGIGAATAGLLAGLRLAVSDTDVVSISWDLGEHFFTKAQAAELNSILQGAAADHVTVVASTGDNGSFSDMQAFASTPTAPGTQLSGTACRR